ncbi:FAD-binding oxidoreductase [Microbacterium murale]|uniref:4-cresol dehydrogenase n=1 Tax=Microbacterium murale TaxID=1081040 RepID=A0ABQ1RGQ0_9MICO|nr:FAD-binding oxidoreductase [Microbacterium murale]GGD65984.1 4-cresol dehydrogenase [Microbacterium murale]
MSIAQGAEVQVASEQLRARLADIVGADHVLIGDDAAEFLDPWATSLTPTPEPAVVVQPASVEEVQAIVRIAAEAGVPVWPSSQGRNYGYGGAAPVVGGSISLNLRRMNQVLELDEQGGYAIVEPGVSFTELHAEISKRGAKLWISTPDLGWGSVVGNTAEHGVGYTEFGDHASAVAGMEVVLPDGTVLRTGLWALPNNALGARAKRGFGPSIDSLFLQSNFGIITKLGIWLAPQPEAFTVGSVILDDAARIPALIDALGPLVQDGTIQGHPLIVSSPEPEGGRMAPWDDTSGGSKKQKMSAVFPPGRVNARVGFYGRPSLISAREAIVREAVAHIPGAIVDLRTYPGDVDPHEVHPLDLVPAGIPNQFLLDMLRKHFGPTVGHFDFSPIIPFTGEAAAQHEAMVMEILDKHDLVAGFGWIAQSRTLIGACMIIFDSSDPEEAARARAAADEMIDRAAEWGWSEYRGHVTIQDRIASLYSAGDGALHRFYSRLKDAVDPAGILAPGSHGIWPSERTH